MGWGTTALESLKAVLSEMEAHQEDGRKSRRRTRKATGSEKSGNDISKRLAGQVCFVREFAAQRLDGAALCRSFKELDEGCRKQFSPILRKRGVLSCTECLQQIAKEFLEVWDSQEPAALSEALWKRIDDWRIITDEEFTWVVRNELAAVGDKPVRPEPETANAGTHWFIRDILIATGQIESLSVVERLAKLRDAVFKRCDAFSVLYPTHRLTNPQWSGCEERLRNFSEWCQQTFETLAIAHAFPELKQCREKNSSSGLPAPTIQITECDKSVSVISEDSACLTLARVIRHVAKRLREVMTPHLSGGEFDRRPQSIAEMDAALPAVNMASFGNCLAFARQEVEWLETDAGKLPGSQVAGTESNVPRGDNGKAAAKRMNKADQGEPKSSIRHLRLDTPKKPRKKRDPDKHSKECIKRFKQYKRDGDRQSMKSVVKEYCAENPGVSFSGTYQRCSDNSHKWKD